MKKFAFATCLFFVLSSRASAQTDAQETLSWVNSQAQKIDTLLQNGILSSNQLSLVYNILDAYVMFDAVHLAGLYCPNIRAAAAEGRNQCDIKNFKYDKDLNSLILRATIARQISFQMRAAAQQCSAKSTEPAKPGFSPHDILEKDVELIELDLSDGLASNDMHLLSQKATHAIRILRDIQHLSYTLENCDKIDGIAHRAIDHCEDAVKSKTVAEASKHLKLAFEVLKLIATVPCE